MAGLGVWLWSHLLRFGGDKINEANSCARSSAVIFIIGKSVPMGSTALRIISLVVYSAFLIPGLNLVLPMVLFLSLFFLWHRYSPKDNVERQQKLNVVPAYAGLGFLLIINILFVVDIEATLKRNSRLQLEGEEDQWGFGQILAVLLLCLPLRDLVETILERRAKRRLGEIAAELKGALESQEIDAIHRAVERGANLHKALDAKGELANS